ncbi:hypothetical protein B484DRAFT_395033 [Ochromonadaceae sp. CCMP2298]|nr:hypothetical protein B484DRAFT_395033 [Ochromonadaceae sp. CCMP2298]
MFANAIYYWVFLNPSVVISQPMDEYQAGCLLWMMGYLLYDTVFEAVSGTQILTLGHHVLGIASHLSSLLSYNGAAGFYSMLIFIAEGSTPALNASWLLQKLGMTKTLLFKAFAAYLMAAFVVVRLALSAYMVVHMVLHEAEWGADTQVLFWFNTVIVFLFGVLNYFWFYKLLVMALK